MHLSDVIVEPKLAMLSSYLSRCMNDTFSHLITPSGPETPKSNITSNALLRLLRHHPNHCMWHTKGNQLPRGEGVKSPFHTIRLSDIHVEMNKTCLNSISVVISFHKIFEIEDNECKS